MKMEPKKFHNKLSVGRRSYRLRELGIMANDSSGLSVSETKGSDGITLVQVWKFKNLGQGRRAWVTAITSL